MMSIIDRINNENNIESFIDESILVHNIRYETELSWMRIFNSKIILSNSFIINHIQFVKWKWMMRVLDEEFIHRYKSNIIQWNAQLYGPSRTFEFLFEYQDKFDWIAISKNPPQWFENIHFQVFGHLMSWKDLSKFIDRMDFNTITMYAYDLDWEWITKHGIRDDAFAKRFYRLINWKHPQIDKSKLVKFLE